MEMNVSVVVVMEKKENKKKKKTKKNKKKAMMMMTTMTMKVHSQKAVQNKISGSECWISSPQLQVENKKCTKDIVLEEKALEDFLTEEAKELTGGL